MKKISVFDTTISDYNLGNQIIMDSIYRHLYDIFPEDFFFKIPTMDITKNTIQYIKWSDLIFFGGTNSLNAHMEFYRQWGVTLKNYRKIKNVILMGIGWWQYEGNVSFYTKFILRRVLNKNIIHSTRDFYTVGKLKEIGFTNVINTGCPTLWDLTEEHCKKIPQNKADDVIFTITDYAKNIKRDSDLILLLIKNYKRVFVWIQGMGDYDYIQKIKGANNIYFLNPNLQSFDEFLKINKVDYVGTRLHAGIRALQFNRRTIIIGIDNRAIEMKKDFNMPVIDQKEINKLESIINSNFETKISIPVENIKIWKNQFIKK